MHFPITSPPSPPPLHPQHQRGSGAAPPTRRGAAVGWRRSRRRLQATSPSPTGRMRRRAPTAAGGGGVPRHGDAATPVPPKARRRSLTSSGVATSWPSVPLMVLRLGRTRFAWRRGAAAVRAAPKHGRCGRRAGGRRRGVGVGRRAARGGGAPLGGRARADRCFRRIFGLVSVVTSLRRVTVFYATSLEF